MTKGPLRSPHMHQLLGLPVTLLSPSLNAQLPWLRSVAMESVYHHQFKEGPKDEGRTFLVFHANDPVLTVIICDREGCFPTENHCRSPLRLITNFLKDHHCEPDRYGIDSGGTIGWGSGNSLFEPIKYPGPDVYGTTFTFQYYQEHLTIHNERYRRIGHWNRVVSPKKKFLPGTSGCAGEEIL